jgi:DNA-binding CsgD family transcriptional regulator
VAQGLKDYQEALQYHQEHLVLCQEIGDLGGIRISLGELSLVAHVLGESEISRQYFRETLNVIRAGHIPWYRKGSVDVYGAVCHLIPEGQIEQAVELLALLHRWDAMPSTRNKWSRWLETLQAELDPDVFAAAVQRGEANDLEIVAAALKERFSVSNEREELAARTEETDSVRRGRVYSQSLSEREWEILHLIADGFDNAEIAERLVLAISTVKWFVHQIFGKLDVTSRTQAVARARTLGLLT